MLKKILYLVILILMSLCVVEKVRSYVLDNLVYPPLLSIAQGSDNNMLYVKCGQLKSITKKYDEAQELFLSVLQKTQNYKKDRARNLAFLYLGNTYYEQKDYDNALKAYSALLKREPGTKKALKKYSRILMAKGEYVELLPYVNGYIRVKPKDSFGHSERCAILTRLDKLGPARNSCEQAILCRKSDARAHYDLAVLNAKAGFKDMAQKELELAKKHQPRIKSRGELERMLNIKKIDPQ